MVLPVNLVTPEDCALLLGGGLRFCQELYVRGLPRESTFADIMRHNRAVLHHKRASSVGLSDEATDREIDEAIRKRKEYAHCLITIPSCLSSQENRQ